MTGKLQKETNHAKLSFLFPHAHTEGQGKPTSRLWPSTNLKRGAHPLFSMQNCSHTTKVRQKKGRDTLVPQAHHVETSTFQRKLAYAMPSDTLFACLTLSPIHLVEPAGIISMGRLTQSYQSDSIKMHLSKIEGVKERALCTVTFHQHERCFIRFPKGRQ